MATAIRDNMRYSSACTALVQVMTRSVVASATIPAMKNVISTAASSGKESFDINRRGLVFGLALALATDSLAGHTVEVVSRALAHTGNQQIIFFVHHVLAIVLAHFEIRCQLDRVGGAGVLAEATIDAAREVDAKSLRVPAAGFVLGLDYADAVDRAGHRAKITGHAAFGAIRIPGQHDATAIARR